MFMGTVRNKYGTPLRLVNAHTVPQLQDMALPSAESYIREEWGIRSVGVPLKRTQWYRKSKGVKAVKFSLVTGGVKLEEEVYLEYER